MEVLEKPEEDWELGLHDDFPSEYKSLQEFDPLTIRNDDAMLIYGPRRSGKSYLYHYLLFSHLRYIYKTLRVFTGSAHSNEWPQVHPEYITEGFDSSIVSAYTDVQAERISFVTDLLRLEKKINIWDNEKTLDQHIYLYNGIVIDDCASEKELHSDHALIALYTKGRHLKTGTTILTQYPNSVAPTVRCNSDKAFLFDFASRRLDEQFAEQFFPDLHVRELSALFKHYYSKKEHTCLVVNVTEHSRFGPDRLFVFNTPSWPAEFVVGDKCYQPSGHFEQNELSFKKVEPIFSSILSKEEN